MWHNITLNFLVVKCAGFHFHLTKKSAFQIRYWKCSDHPIYVQQLSEIKIGLTIIPPG